MRFGGPHAEPPPPASIFRFFMRLSFPMRFRGLPRRHLLIGIAVPPYGHTPDASPHTSRQIPTGRPFSHSNGRSPIDRPSPHTIHNLLKVGLSFDETSGSSSTNPQPTPTSKHPGPASRYGKPSANRFKQITRLQSTQNKHRPSPANATDLRLGGAVTSCMCMLIRTYGHGHACTGMRTLSWARARPWSCAHGHSHARP